MKSEMNEELIGTSLNPEENPKPGILTQKYQF
jgi:hypothetical protein